VGGLGGANLGGESTYFIQTFKKRVLSRNLGQNVLKNAYILEKSCKIAAVSGVCRRWLSANGDYAPRPKVVTPFY